MAAIGTRKMKIEIDGVEYTPEVTNARFAGAEGDAETLTFAEADGSGGRDYTFNFTALQDLAVGSLWRLMFDSPGEEFPVTLMPEGNAVPTAAQPHVTATVIVGEPDGDFLGGEANRSAKARMTWDGSWETTGRPTLVSA